MSDRVNRHVVAELRHLEATGVLTPLQARRVAERYPTEGWDVVSLIRVFTILGAISAGAGAVVLASEHVNALRLLEAGLALTTVLLLAGARWVRTKDMHRSAAAMEMGAGFAVQGFTTVLAIDLATGSKNWPALVGIQAVILLTMAYALGNRLVLGHAAVTTFVWFGGETGYASDFGMYWLGTSYPMRFALAGAASLGVAWLHAKYGGRYQPFARVYGHFGLLVMNLALWIMSLVGNYQDYNIQWNNPGERLTFTAVWAVISCGFIFGGARYGIGLLRSYGVVFLIINVYTFYFQFLAYDWASLWWLHLLIAGGSLLVLGFRLERWLHARGVMGSSR